MRRGIPRVLVLALVATAAGPAGSSAQDARRPVAAAPQPARAPGPAAKAAAAPAAAQPDPNDPRMKQLLAAWERQAAKLKTLDAKIIRVDRSPAWGNEEFEGRVLLASPNLAFLDFKKVEAEAKGQRKLVPHERIICTGTEVWQFRSDVKQVFIFPLDRQNKQRALEEGPLPFLFNFKAVEAEERYNMALVNETKTAYIISVVPRLRVDQEAFSKAFIQLVRATFLPDRIVLISPDGKSTKDFTLTDLGPNAPVSKKNFEGRDPGPPWQIVRDPGGNLAAPKAEGVAKRQPPAAAADAAPPRRAAVAPRRAPAN